MKSTVISATCLRVGIRKHLRVYLMNFIITLCSRHDIIFEIPWENVQTNYRGHRLAQLGMTSLFQIIIVAVGYFLSQFSVLILRTKDLWPIVNQKLIKLRH